MTGGLRNVTLGERLRELELFNLDSGLGEI